MFEMTFLDLNEQVIPYLTQWDADQEIIITGEFTDAPLVHFCNKNSKYALCVQSTLLSNEKIQVAIPNILLCEPYPLLIYVYSVTGKTGKKTIISGKIPVRPRIEPENRYFEENYHVVYLAELEKQVIELNDAITAAENERISNENNRIAAEEERESTFDESIESCKNATEAANTAATNANNAADNSKDATQDAIEATNTANEKIVIMQQLIESMNNFTVTFTEAEIRENIVSGETLSVLFGKIKKWFTDIEASHEEDVTESDIAQIVI